MDWGTIGAIIAGTSAVINIADKVYTYAFKKNNPTTPEGELGLIAPTKKN